MKLVANAMSFSLLPRRLLPLLPCKISRIAMSSLPFERICYKHELAAAVAVVEKACLLTNSVRTSIIRTDKKQAKKSDLSPVTIADFAVQSLISMELGLLFPSIPLVAEEDATYLRLQMEEKGDETIDQPSLLGMVVEAVSKVASPGVRPVNSVSVLEAIDRGAVTSTDKRSFWVLDPIDGTRGFLEGGDALYVVQKYHQLIRIIMIALSLVVEGTVVLGVMGCPFDRANMISSLAGKRIIWTVDNIMNQGKIPSQPTERGSGSNGVLIAASKGCGSWLKYLDLEVKPRADDLNEHNFVPSVVDGITTLRDARFGLSRHETWDLTPLSSLVDSAAQSKDLVYHFCCGSLCKYFAVAIGAVSAVLLPQTKENVKVWDHAAGFICVQEAGGKVTDGQGSELESLLTNGNRTFVPGGGSILVSNGHLHQMLLGHLSKQRVL